MRSASPGATDAPVIIYLLSVGFVSILAQVVVLRELTVAFFGVELVYILAIAAWLLWTALGAVIGRRSHGGSRTAVAYLLVVFALLLPADVAFVRALRTIFGGVPGTYLPFQSQVIGLLAALFPLGIVLGLLFQQAAKVYIGETRTLARAYAIESAGGVLGGLASTLLLYFGVRNFMIAVLCAAFALAAVLAAGGARRAAASAVLVILALALSAERIDDALTRTNHPALVESRDSPYSRITLTRRGEQSVVYENDVLAFETENVTAEEFIHLAAVQADSLGRVLVLGGGIEGLVAEILQYAPARVDYVELNPVLLSLAEAHLPPSAWEPLASKPVTVTIADPRRFVKEASSRYDLIAVGMPDPTSGQSNRFYTSEFFGRCAEILAPGGVLALRLRSSENVWTPFLTYRNASIFRALDGTFGDVVVLPGATNVVVASNDSLSRDPELLGSRLKDRDVATRLVTPQYISYLYTNDRFFGIADALSSAEVPANTDTRPVCYKYSSMIWLSKFFPGLIASRTAPFGPSPNPPLAASAAAIGVLCGFFALCRRRARCRRIVVAALAGLIGMVLETALILHYQVKSGVLFQNLGILLMVFMAGLAAGAAAVPYFARNGGFNSLQKEKLWGMGLFGAFAVLNVTFIGLLRTDTAGLPTVSLLLFAGGALVSGLFAYATFLGAGSQRALVSPLYAADLVGGCVGSVLGSVLMVPFLGMEQTAAAMALLSLSALLFL